MSKPGDRIEYVDSVYDPHDPANPWPNKLEAIKCPTGYCGDDEGGECPACLGTGILWREVVDDKA